MAKLATLLVLIALGLTAFSPQSSAQDAPQPDERAKAQLSVPELSEAERLLHADSLAVLKKLDSDSAIERSDACRALSQIWPRCPQSVPRLVGVLLNDKYAMTRAAAAHSLWMMGPSAAPAVPALILAVQDQTMVAREAISALGGLGRIGIPSVTALVQVIQTPKHALAWDALYALTGFARLGADIPAGPVVDRLCEEEAYPALAAAELLLVLGPRAAGEWERVYDLCKSPEEGMTARGLPVLAAMAGPDQYADVIEIAESELAVDGGNVPAARALAILGRHATPAVNTLIGCVLLEDKVPYEACKALASIGTPAIAALLKHEKSTFATARLGVAHTLGLLAHKDAKEDARLVAALAGLSADPDPSVRKAAMQSLTAFGTAALAAESAAIKLALGADDAEARSAAWQLLRVCGTKSEDAAKAARTGSADKDKLVAANAAMALYAVTSQAQASVEVFRGLLALEKDGPSDSTSAVLHLARDFGESGATLAEPVALYLDYKRLAPYAARALGAYGPKAAVALPKLKACISSADPHDMIAISGQWALSRILTGDERVTNLRTALKSKSAAMWAVAAMGLLQAKTEDKDNLLAIVANFLYGNAFYTFPAFLEMTSIARELKPLLHLIEDRWLLEPATAADRRAEWEALRSAVKAA